MCQEQGSGVEGRKPRVLLPLMLKIPSFFFFFLGFVLLCIFKGKCSKAMKGGAASILLLAAVSSQKLEVKCLLQIQL